MIERRRFLGLAAAAVLPGLVVAPARAQQWPARPVRLVVPFTPGGANDSIARMLAPALAEMWSQPVLVENKPGAGANIGTEAVARSLPDGYTVLVTSMVHAVNRFLYPSVRYDPVADFAPVTLICLEPNVMAVPAASTARTAAEFIEQAKARPMSYASAGNGTSLHLCAEMFKRRSGIELTHVPYKGSAPAVADLIGGRVDVMFGSSGSMLPHARGGRLRAIAVTTAARIDAAPQLPTVAESGVPGFDVSSWFAMFAPAGTPPDVVKAIHAGTAAALAQPAVRERLAQIGAVIVASAPDALAAHLQGEMGKWGALVREAKLRADL